MKKTFKIKIVETVEKTVEIKADNLYEAEMIAQDEDMGKNYNDYSFTTTLLEERHDNCKYPVYINGWNLVYPENLTYWKERKPNRNRKNSIYVAVSLYWLDTIRGDEGYNPEHDSWVILKGIGDTVEEALEDLDIMPGVISDVGRRDDIENVLFTWMESEEG